MEKKNFNLDEVIRLNSVLEFEPMFNDLFITLNTEAEDGSLVLSDNVMAERQFVIAIGSMVREVEPFQEVLLDMEKMMVTEYDPENPHEKIQRIKIKPIEISGHMFGIIDERSIKAKVKNQ